MRKAKAIRIRSEAEVQEYLCRRAFDEMQKEESELSDNTFGRVLYSLFRRKPCL